MPGFDLSVYSPRTRKSCTVQVKFRTNETAGLHIASLEFDFLVLVGKAVERIASVNQTGGARVVRERTWPMWVVPKADVFTIGHLTNPRYDDYYLNWAPLLASLGHEN